MQLAAAPKVVQRVAFLGTHGPTSNAISTSSGSPVLLLNVFPLLLFAVCIPPVLFQQESP